RRRASPAGGRARSADGAARPRPGPRAPAGAGERGRAPPPRDLPRLGVAYVVAVDQGTTGSTVLVFDRLGRVVGRAYSEFTQHYPRPGWVEHDAEEIWRVTLRVLRQACRRAGARGRDIQALGITNQRETTVLWSRRTGRPVHRAIVWQDRRTAAYCDELRARCSTTSTRGRGTTSCARSSACRAACCPPSIRRAARSGRRPPTSWARPSRSPASRATSRRRCSARAASSRAWRRTPTAPAAF